MAASTSNPLHTKSIQKNPRVFIQMMDHSGDSAAMVQAIRKWCALHKTEKHSNADCRAQRESATSTTATSKKRPMGTVKQKSTKPRRLKFKSNTDMIKFLHSIEDTEGVSLESASSDDEYVVEQSLMQLENASSSEVLEEEEESDLHILFIDPEWLLEDHDVAMDSLLSCSHDQYESHASTEDLDSAVSGIHLGGEKVTSPALRLPSVSPMSTKADFSSVDTTLLNTAINTPVVSITPFKEEENPFSPSQYPSLDEDMYPSLTTEASAPPQATSSPPQDRILIRGVYYQPVPPPHNVVVTQSSIPTPALAPAEIPLPATDNDANGSDYDSIVTAHSGGESPSSSATVTDPIVTPAPKGAQEFAVPENPPSGCATKTSKDRRRSRPRSRSSSSRRSRNRRQEMSRASNPQGITPPDTTVKRIRGIGRGKAKETVEAPLLAPTTPLSGITVPRENVRITIPAGSNQRIVEVIPGYPTNVCHLAKLEGDASNRWDLQLPKTVELEFVVELPQDDPSKDSDIDLRTGEVKKPNPWREPIRFSYRALSVLDDHQRFAEEVLRQEPDSWDHTQVENSTSIFYQAYFLDQQKLSEVRGKGTVKIQQFNVKVIRQSPERNVSASSKAN